MLRATSIVTCKLCQHWQDQTFSLTSSDWHLILNVLSSSLAQNHRLLRTSNTWHGKRAISGFGSTEKSRRDFTTRLLVHVSHDQISILKETCQSSRCCISCSQLCNKKPWSSTTFSCYNKFGAPTLNPYIETSDTVFGVPKMYPKRNATQHFSRPWIIAYIGKWAKIDNLMFPFFEIHATPSC